MQPRTQYTKSGDVNIAYQVHGDGPIDIIYVPGWISHLEVALQNATFAHICRRLSAFSRLILFDKRGTGLSDRDVGFPTLEQRMDDLRAVMDKVGSEQAAVFGHSEGGNMSILFAATYPERTSALILFGTFAKRLWAPDYPWAPTPEAREAWAANMEREWREGIDVSRFAPSCAGDQAFADWLTTYNRYSASPGTAMMLARLNSEIDVRGILPAVQTPTLILHRIGDQNVNVEESNFLAEKIPNSKFVKLPGADHTLFAGDVDGFTGEIEEFLTGVRHDPEPDRVLATVLFTDIANSTERAAEMGDRKWCDLLASHHSLIRGELSRFRGREIDTAGDGFFATFDGPARAIHCAEAIQNAVTQLGLTIRVGLHTGECEVMDGKITGIAVHIGARVMSLASPKEVLVTSTVKDLVAGSGIGFVDRGVHALKGVPGEWRLYTVS